MSLNILVVEDEPKVQRFIRQALEQSGMTVETLESLDDLDSHLERTKFDVLILDRLVGKRDSLSLLSRIKKIHLSLKVLVLSALGEVEDRVSGLELGADDYLPKPFHVSELIARVRNISRRNTESEKSDTLLQYLDLEIRFDTQEVKRSGKVLSLTAKEFKLLTLMARWPKKIFSRSDLLDRVWGLNLDPGTNVVEVTLNRLRTKVDEGNAISLIHTRRGSGYWFGENKEND
ncbi:MAG: response regulator [Bacteriovoracaceae bacterium]|nr:response regulator [Bacteriovoracaceae bacterium]